MNKFHSTSLRDIMILKDLKRQRVSSFDPTGGNMDNIQIKPGEKRVIFDQDGPGCITHIWTTQLCMKSKFWLRNIIIRIWWDEEKEASVECPLGDFFGMGHAQRKNFISEPLQMSPEKGKGFNCWWPMPFQKHAKIEIENDDPNSCYPNLNNIFKRKPGIIFYYYVDYELYDEWPFKNEKIGYFHAQFRRMDYKKDIKRDFDSNKKLKPLEWQMGKGKNTAKNGGYDRNYVILEASGKGQYVGCHINIDNQWRWNYNWPGEGDDMIFIDEDIERNEPTLYGTGTEDYVNTAFCPQEEYSAPYHGIIKGGRFNWLGKITYYRYHIQDPIRFEKAIKVTIEHGHNNVRGDDWSTTSYWYQIEPHQAFPIFPNLQQRKPRKDPKLLYFCSKIGRFLIKLVGIGMLVWLFNQIFRIIGI